MGRGHWQAIARSLERRRQIVFCLRVFARRKLYRGGHATATEKLEDREIIVWDIATGLAVKVLAGKADFVQALAFTGDDKTLVAAGPEGVRRWNLALGKEVSVWQPLERENQSAKSRGAPTKGIFNSWLSSDGKSLALAVVTNHASGNHRG